MVRRPQTGAVGIRSSGGCMRTPVVHALCCALLPLGAAARPGYYVVTPYDSAGKAIVDVRYWSTHPDRGGRTVWPELGVGYGVTSRWTTEVYASHIGPSVARSRANTLNWQNQFLLTQGELPVDIAAHLQFIRDRTGKGYDAIEYGPLLQTDIGRTQLNGNLVFERARGSGAEPRTQLKYQWQVRHRFVPQLHFGAQGFGEIGSWDDWPAATQQSHRAGPALFFTWHVDERRALRTQAAYLVGKTNGKAGRMFTMRAHVEF